MLALSEINQIGKSAAVQTLKGVDVKAVRTEPSLDSEGAEALSVTVIVKSDTSRTAIADGIIEFILRVHEDLIERGDPRIPITQIMTEEEALALDAAGA